MRQYNYPNMLRGFSTVEGTISGVRNKSEMKMLLRKWKYGTVKRVRQDVYDFKGKTTGNKLARKGIVIELPKGRRDVLMTALKWTKKFPEMPPPRPKGDHYYIG